MLSFYEFNCLLDTHRKAAPKLNEAGLSPEQIAQIKLRQDAIKKKVAQSKAGKVEPTTPAPTEGEPKPTFAGNQPAPKAPKPAANPSVLAKADAPAAPAPEAPATPAAAKPLKRNVSPDVNDPSAADRLGRVDQLHQQAVNQGTSGTRVNSSRAMSAVPTNKSKDITTHRSAELISNFNSYLNSVTFQVLTQMAVAELGLPYQIPEGKFRVSTVPEPKSLDNVVVMQKPDLLKVIRKVLNYTKQEKGDTGYGTNVSYRQALVKPYSHDESARDVLLRTLQFEGQLHNPAVIGKPMTIAQLAHTLGGLAVKGGLENPNANNDVDIVSYMIETAQKNGFGKFFQVNGDLNDPNTQVTVVPLDKLSGAGDSFGTKLDKAIGSAQPQAAPQPKLAGANESTDWMSIVESMEHWGF